ncbi:IS66 family insertion sequence element accessory protein TnpB [Zoogloea sp.]|uniref:IS66 family insertion sequence element accessory protein TnpB n=1 Tax=Zoogloea sp. TaxID=49181 RepID=UPI001D1F491F|nr:IS66 family insertion sequence element accessory protein TnpB [Zoogloea sp.]MBK6656235.1 IS66 family insertion sequence element accessory protein TnpB [Zoogloea sp.]
MKVLIHDGLGLWLACRRLNQGRFRWAEGNGSMTLTQAQFDALVLGLPWQQLGGDGVIRMILFSLVGPSETASNSVLVWV